MTKGLLLALLMLFVIGCGGTSTAKQPDKIRIGWQTPWATQGQVTQVLKHTNILALNGLEGEFTGVSYGGPLNQAALAGSVDVIFTADQPAATLLAAGGKWTIIGRLMYNRTATYVPPDSPIKSIADLRGKTVAMPYGAAAQRNALRAIKDAGLDPAKDIKSKNLDILEQNAIVQAGNRQSWPGVDALVGFDPTPAIFEHQGLARMLEVSRVVSLVVMSNDYLKDHPQAAYNFSKSFVEAWFYYASNQNQANAWFKKESGLTFDEKVLDVASSVEPNIKAKSIQGIRPLLHDEDLKIMQEGADFIYEQKLAKTKVEMAQFVDQSLMTRAMEELTKTKYDPKRVKVISP